MSLRWWETKRKRNEKGHFVKKKRPAWKTTWRKIKIMGAKAKEKLGL